MHKRSCNNAQAKGLRIEPLDDRTFTRAIGDGHLYKLEVIPICSLLRILSSIFYFAYRVKCILNGQAQASGLELLVDSHLIFIELGVTCKCSCPYK